MKKALWVVAVLLVAGGVSAGLWWQFTHPPKPADHLVLYGNIDLRQVDLPFNNNERITEVLVQEGDRLHQGQVLARLDRSRLEPQVAQVEAQAAAQRAAVERLHHGNRPEEIAQAQANVEATRADAKNAKIQLERVKSLAHSTAGRAVSQQDLDNAQAAFDMANARLELNQKALDLAVIGPRKEDIAQAEAQLKGYEAQLALVRRQLFDTELYAPLDAVVRARLMEPGEMAAPQRAVFTLAITDPKWVRAYVSEVDLGRVHPGMAAAVLTDSFPGRRFDGWVGFISSVAEFTPKSIETEELRPKLMYEVRVFVKDPADELRLGMPATVELARKAESGATQPATQPNSAGTPPTSTNSGPEGN